MTADLAGFDPRVGRARRSRAAHDDQRTAPPALADGMVDRPGLVARLDAATSKKLVLVVAPPGYGKSVLLTQWAAVTKRRTVAWLALRPEDDATTLATYLCAALASVDGLPRTRLLDRVGYGGREIGDRFIHALLADTVSLPPTVLVLDDFHALESPALVAELASIIELAPPQLHFVVSSRMDPALPYHRLRLSDAYAELRQDDLAFGPSEAAELIERITERPPTAAQIAALLARTEGWGAGLHLAALSLRPPTDVDGFINTFAGDDRHVSEYLTEHVLRQQPTEVRDFLLETSVLDRMCASLCDAVTGRTDGQQMLEQLSRRSLFISKVDAKGEWYRTHQLFRDLLRSHFRAARTDVESDLLRRAAAWSFDHDDPEAGGEYLQAAGAVGDLVAAVRTYGHVMYARGRIATVGRWLASLDPSARSTPDVALLEAACLMLAGDTAIAGTALDDLDEQDGLTAAQRLMVDLIRTWAVHDEPRPRRVIDATERVLRAVDVVSPSDIPDVLGLTAPNAVRKGALLNAAAAAAFDDADGVVRSYLDRAPAVPSTGALLDIDEHGLRALVDAWSGSLRSAEGHGYRAIAVAREADLAGHPSVAVAHLALARVAMRRADGDATRAHLSDARALLERTKPSLLVAVHAAERALATVVARPDLADEILESHRSASAPTLPTRIAGQLEAAEVQVLLALGDDDRANLVAGRATGSGPELRDVRIFLAVHEEQYEAARHLIEAAPIDRSDQEQLRLLLWGCVLDDATGAAPDQVRERLAAIVAEAAEEGDVRLLLDAGHHAARLLRALYHAGPSSFLRRVIDAPSSTSSVSATPVAILIEQLTDRERAVLHLLPTRLTNVEIAERLHVSVNTLKTHLKHIYRKLSVTSRREAITAAEDARLL